MAQITHMRLLALPLTKRVGTLEPLVYYYAQMPPARPSPSSSSGASDAASGPSTSLVDRAQGLFKKGLNTATKTWVGFGKKPPKSWQNRLYNAGQRVYRRIDFEELALTSVEPALGPTVFRDREGERERLVQEAKERGEPTTIPLLYPSFLPPPSPSQQLTTLLSHRLPRHSRSLTLYLILCPLTAPFALVPVIPNIPFFYCAWRAWGHYRALRGGRYLDKVVKSHAVVETPSPLLDKLYQGFGSRTRGVAAPSLASKGASLGEEKGGSVRARMPTSLPITTTTTPPSSPSSPSSSPFPSAQPPSDSPSDYLLLGEEDVPALLRAFGLPEEGGVELEIAVGQARRRVGEELKSLKGKGGKGVAGEAGEARTDEGGKGEKGQ